MLDSAMAAAEKISVVIFFITILDTSSSGDGERIRRNSDSAIYFKPEEKLSLLKLKRADAELKFLKGRIAVVEREITAQLSPDILEAHSPDEKAAILKQHDRWKGERIG